MSTSPPFDVVMLWGDRWWISGLPEPLPFGPLSRAAEVLLGHFSQHGKPPRLRLIYQPMFLVSVPVQCPNGNRDVLQLALQDEHPPLANPHAAWGFEPGVGGGIATLLHYENEPFLFSLVAILRHGGVAVEGAWPLSTVLNLIPEDWPDTGALAVAAVASDQALVFRHTPLGAREVNIASGDETDTVAQAAIQQAAARKDTALYVVALGEAAQRLVSRAQGQDQFPVLGWEDLVRAARTLSMTQPNQLLPAIERFDFGRLATGVTVVALLTAGVVGVQLVRSTVAASEFGAQEIGRSNELRSEIESLRINEDEIQSMRSQLSEPAAKYPAAAELLGAITRQLPTQVVLTRIQADQDGFTLSGGLSSAGLNEPDWRAWCEGLRSGKWHLTLPAPMPTAAFILRGVWQ